MAENNAVVGVHNRHAEAEAIYQRAPQVGVRDEQTVYHGQRLSHPTTRHPLAYNAGDRMRPGTKLGVFWSGLWGLLVGSTFLCRESATAAGLK